LVCLRILFYFTPDEQIQVTFCSNSDSLCTSSASVVKSTKDATDKHIFAWNFLYLFCTNRV
jgi:hypothetical protein